MDRLVLGLVALSAACFLAFALWPRSSPRGPLDVVRAADDGPSTPIFGKATTPASEPVATAVVDNAKAAQGVPPPVRLTETLRLRRRRGRCDWWRQ